MKKSVLVFSMTTLLVLGGFNIATAQEQPAPKKDTVNMDTQAQPTFYYAVEDDKAAESKKGGSSTIIIIAAAVVVAGAAGFFLMKKKK